MIRHIDRRAAGQEILKAGIQARNEDHPFSRLRSVEKNGDITTLPLNL